MRLNDNFCEILHLSSCASIQETRQTESIDASTNMLKTSAINRIGILFNSSRMITTLWCIHLSIKAVGEQFAKAFFGPGRQILNAMNNEPDMTKFVNRDTLKEHSGQATQHSHPADLGPNHAPILRVGRAHRRTQRVDLVAFLEKHRQTGTIAEF